MNLTVCGLNHRTADVQLRDRVAIGPDLLGEALSNLIEYDAVEECMIVSTCNRTEIYTVTNRSGSPNGTSHPAVEFFLDFHGLELSDIEPCLYQFDENEAVHHMFKVVCGLDSMVLGENQIIGQVREAYAAACDAGCSGHLLNRLAHMAFRVGKEVRTKTGLNEGSLSVSYAACDLAADLFGSLSDTTVLVVGTGETGDLVADNMKKRGVTDMMVTNRTRERAETLASKLECESVPLSDLHRSLRKADIVVCCTASPHCVLTSDMVAYAMKDKPGTRPMALIDLAVPRDVEASAGRIENVHLYNIDGLQRIVETNSAKRNIERKKAMRIVERSVKQFDRWRRTLVATPTICGVQSLFEQIRQDELNRYTRNMAEEDRERLDEVTDAIVSRIAKLAITNIRDTVVESDDSEFLENIQRLFGLE